MKTYIFPYSRDDGSIALWINQAACAADAVRGFQGEIGLSTEPEIVYAEVALAPYDTPVMRTLHAPQMQMTIQGGNAR